jgi:hypothetical protein
MAIRGVLRLNDTFEQTQIAIAGFMSSLDITSDFNRGLVQAEKTINQIRISAALLPGEAEEYIEVFTMGLPMVQRAIGGTVEDMTQFTNNFTAITKTLGIDSAQAARDLTLMLAAGRGIAGMRVKSFQRMLPFMRKIKNQADLNTKSFNAMTQPERAELMVKAMELMDPMLKRSATSFDAMAGAVKSNTREIVRLGTKPLFEAAKKALAETNALLYDEEGQLASVGARAVDIGDRISTSIVSAVELSVKKVKELGGAFDRLAQSPALRQIGGVFQGLSGAAAQLGRGLMGLAGAAPAPAPEGAAGAPPAAEGLAGTLQRLIGPVSGLEVAIGAAAAAAAIWAGLGPVGMVLSGAFTSLMSNTEAVSAIWGSLMAIINMVISTMGPIIGLFTALSSSIGILAGGVLPGVMGGLQALLGAVLPLIGAIANIASALLGALGPAFRILGGAIGRLVMSIGGLLAPIIALLGASMQGLAHLLSAVLSPVIGAAAEILGALIDVVGGVIAALGALVAWIGEQIGIAQAAAGRAEKAAGRRGEMGIPWQMGEEVPAYDPLAPAPTIMPRGGGGGGGARGGGGRAKNDFRFSRFEITQKFEEGFDPDRIAIAFSQDLGRIAEQRIQSGFEPIFAVR